MTPDSDAQDELNIMNQVMLSRDNLLSVIRETDLDLTVNTPLEKEKLVAQLANSISVKRTRGGQGRGNNMYEISYTSTSDKLVYQVVSNLLNTMIEDTLKSTRIDTASAQKFIDQQIAGYEERLSVSEQKLAEFKKANVGYMPDETGNYYTRLRDAQAKVEKSRSDLNLAKQRLTELQKQLSGESPILDSAAYQSTYLKKLQLYESQLAELLNQYTDQYPDVLALKAKISELKTNKNSKLNINSGDDRMAAEFNPVYQEMKVQMSKAGVEIQMLRTQLSEQEKHVQKLKDSIDVIPEVEAKLVKLNRDYEITKERYRNLVERRESASLAQNVGQSTSDVTFRVIEAPIIPTLPSGPMRLLFLAGVLVVALAAGMGWSYLRFMLHPTFFRLNQVREKTGLPILGTVSLYISPEYKTRRRIQMTSFIMATFLLIVVCAGVLIFNQEGVELAKTIISD